MNTTQMFELILNRGVRNTTYKFGLLTSLADYVIENPLESPRNNFHFIPIFYLAKQFLAYYLPLIVKNIRQGPESQDKSPTAIKKMLLDFYQSKEIKQQFPFLLEIENINLLLLHINNNEKLPQSLIKSLFYIRKKIIEQPLQHILKVDNDLIWLFGLLSSGESFQSDFEIHREKGRKLKLTKLKETKTWNDLLLIENLFLFFSHQTFQEISKLRFWLRDVLIKRWAQESIEKFNANEPNLLSLFDLWKRSPQRDSFEISKYRLLYLENGLRYCTYCGKFIEKDFEIDHLFPWTIFPINSFWNLYPVCKSCNIVKSDKIPIITPNRAKRISKHIDLCLQISGNKKEIIEMDVLNFYQSRFNSTPKGIDKEMKIGEITGHIHRISLNLQEIKPGYLFE